MGSRVKSQRKTPVENTGLLNDLDSREFIKHKRSWIVVDAKGEPEWKDLKKLHPATFPRALARYLMECYTKEGMTVLDPMMGSGTTVVEAGRFGRQAIGNDLYLSNVQIAEQVVDLMRTRGEIPPADEWRPQLHRGDALNLATHLPDDSVDYCMFSPPYANFLHRSSGGVETRHKERKREGLATTYGLHPQDIGNVDPIVCEDYLVRLARELWRVVRPGKVMSIIIQNEMRKRLNPIAWKLAIAIGQWTLWEMLPEQLWCQSEKPLTIHGWPSRLIINNHHHYILNFEKELR